ncbi:hypothetical protein P153DRAFT_357727 [Dothidotthia symphoricarpi CBS 119687]|uniref:Galactose oxidase n=1 Tax=Dothidotthia symphoricarpi CBS 119687 TaxID=1392245 RepID=A0A6A6ACB6_9PLEO|nr:uncharacterized protein P153DRAFT_357727 [Dothidotthia symphoricarpi CBS 119687]KAF2128361.1 hypothetical protein P153DRAFT_357727 [Dothidotthia symphoricarpi CBS 119687]
MRLAIYSTLLSLVTAQQNIQDPIENFCRRHQHQTCVIDSKLYIDGGLVYYGGGVTDENIPQKNTWLISEDLTDLSTGFPPQNSNLTKGSEVPSVSGGVLWPDQTNKLFYLFGGEYNNASAQDFTALWFYDTIYNTWNRSLPDGSQSQVSWPSFGAGTVDDEGVAYYYGGYLNNKTVSGWEGDALMLNSLLSYNMDDKRWSNITSGVPPRAEGTLHYIPASDRGMLVHIGGVERLSNGHDSYVNMSQIHLHDIASSTWYTQTATGDIPQPRRAFCAGVTWAADHSSYNIYVWGGIGSDETALGDVYILSLPSFKWISWYPDPQMSTFPNGKGWSSCNVISESQMVIIGGYYTNVSKTDCDVYKTGGQHGLLLGEESTEQNNQWHGLMANISSYRVPKVITAVVGGGINGSATATAPAAGWTTSDLSIYFRTSYSATSRTAMRFIPESSAAPTSGNQHSARPSHTNVGAIAGGVVGGVAGLVGVIVLVICCLRSRRRKRNQNSTQPPYQHNPSMTEKPGVGVSVSQGTTMHSPSVLTPTYSPQGSPIPPSDHHVSSTYYQGSPLQNQHSEADWIQQSRQVYANGQVPVQYANQQTYYPPPPDPSQSSSGHNPPTTTVELPGIRSPANAELSDMSSPVPFRGV